MNWTRRISEVAIVGIIATVLLIPQGMVANVDAAHKLLDIERLDPVQSRGDTLGDMQIRAIFYFASGPETVDSFHIFEQVPGGYSYEGPNAFTLIGGISADKVMLYHITDSAHHVKHSTTHSEFTDFDVDVILQIEDKPYRQFSYSRCHVDDYNITTLYDLEETFSKKDLKFVVADIFSFQCADYHPHCPICEAVMNPHQEHPDTVSSLDLESPFPTWQDQFTSDYNRRN